MKKLFNTIKALILAWFEAEQTNTETSAEQTDRMAGSNFF